MAIRLTPECVGAGPLGILNVRLFPITMKLDAGTECDDLSGGKLGDEFDPHYYITCRRRDNYARVIHPS